MDRSMYIARSRRTNRTTDRHKDSQEKPETRNAKGFSAQTDMYPHEQELALLAALRAEKLEGGQMYGDHWLQAWRKHVVLS